MNKLWLAPINLMALLMVITLGACQESPVVRSSASSESPTASSTSEATTPPTPSASSSPMSTTEEPSGGETPPAAEAKLPHAVFAPILSELQGQTQLPVLLPSVLPEEKEQPQVYAITTEVSGSEYQVLLGFSPDCNGGNACRWGEVSGQTGPLTPPEGGESVTLAQGITGYFVPAVCGANCSDAVVMWEQSGGHYSVGLKAADKEQVMEMANSAIATAP